MRSSRFTALELAQTLRYLPDLVVVLALLLAVVLPVSVVAACAIVGITLWIRTRRHVRVRRRAAESAALQGALDILVGELRVGAHPAAAFGVAAGEIDGVVAASLRAVAARARLGADVPAGLHSMTRGSSMPAHWGRLAVCWQLPRITGWRSRR
jgi:tight adherence protein B